MPGFSEAKSAGFVLAAILADDRALLQVQDRVETSAAQAIQAVATRTAGADKGSAITQLLARVRPRPTSVPARLSVRMAALLARQLPADVARQLLSRAPAARAAYEPPRDLLPRLMRIARHASSAEPS